MERKLADILAQADAHLEYQAMGAAPPQGTHAESLVKGAANTYLEHVIVPLIQTIGEQLSKCMRRTYLQKQKDLTSEIDMHKRILLVIEKGDSSTLKNGRAFCRH